MNNKKTILIADDEELIREALVRILVEAGFNVHSASNGLEAIQIIREHSIDLFICDIDMPVINGLQLLKQLGKAPFKVIMFTGLGTPERVKESITYGAVDFMVKSSFKTGDFLKRVQKTLNCTNGTELIKKLESTPTPQPNGNNKYSDFGKYPLDLDFPNQLKKSEFSADALIRLVQEKKGLENHLIRFFQTDLFSPKLMEPSLEKIIKYVGESTFIILASSLYFWKNALNSEHKEMVQPLFEQSLFCAAGAYMMAYQSKLRQPDLCFAQALCYNLPILIYLYEDPDTFKAVFEKSQKGATNYRTTLINSLTNEEKDYIIKGFSDCSLDVEFCLSTISHQETGEFATFHHIIKLCHQVVPCLQVSQSTIDYLPMIEDQTCLRAGIKLPAEIHQAFAKKYHVFFQLRNLFFPAQKNGTQLKFEDDESSDTGTLLLAGAYGNFPHPLEIRYKDFLNFKRGKLDAQSKEQYDCIFYDIGTSSASQLHIKNLESFFKKSECNTPVIVIAHSTSADYAELVKLPIKIFKSPLQAKAMDSVLMRYRILSYGFENIEKIILKK
jgi:CheY-like chemotaxis protein